MDTLNAIPDDAIADKIYAGFFKRIVSGLIDWTIQLILQLIPFSLLFFVGWVQKYHLIILDLITGTIWFVYYVTIPQYLGGTFGKLLLKMNILKTDFTTIGFKEAFLRYLFSFIWLLYDAIVKITITLNTNDELYDSFNTATEWNKYLNANEPKLSFVFLILITTWVLSEYIVLLFNKKKRGLQDYLAGTIVVNTKYLNQWQAEKKEGHWTCSATPLVASQVSQNTAYFAC